MNRRPQKSRSSYDAFSPHHTTRFKAASPDDRFFESRPRRSPSAAVFHCALLILPLILALNFLCNLFVFADQVQVPITGLSADFEGYTLLHLSDLKGASFGADQSRLMMAIKDAQYDAVVMTGDLVSPLGSAQPLYALVDALKAAKPNVPIYFIAGDSDPVPASMAYASGGSPFAPWILGMEQRGAVLLSAPQRVVRGEKSLWLATASQLNLDLNTMQSQYEQSYLRALETGDQNEIELAKHNLAWLEETRSARKAMKEEDIYITLTHTPPVQQELFASPDSLTSRIDLVLCGHYLGGMMRLPLAGPIFIPSQKLPMYGLFPGADTHCGLSRINRTWVYTSPGLGSDNALYPRLFFRLFNPPTVSLITLTPSSL